MLRRAERAVRRVAEQREGKREPGTRQVVVDNSSDPSRFPAEVTRADGIQGTFGTVSDALC